MVSTNAWWQDHNLDQIHPSIKSAGQDTPKSVVRRLSRRRTSENRN